MANLIMVCISFNFKTFLRISVLFILCFLEIIYGQVNLTDQKEPTLDFQNIVQDSKEINQNISYYKKVIKPTPEEIKKHKDYLKLNLKKNYFN